MGLAELAVAEIVVRADQSLSVRHLPELNISTAPR
jgi:hypothetical protein